MQRYKQNMIQGIAKPSEIEQLKTNKVSIKISINRCFLFNTEETFKIFQLNSKICVIFKLCSLREF